MLIRFKDVQDLRLLSICLHYFHHEIANGWLDEKFLLSVPRLERIIDEIDKEIDYYDFATQEN